MSLLLEALKKAELNKQGAQQRSPVPGTEPTLGLTLELEQPRPSVITRESLPDISPSLEIHAEDFRPAAELQRPADKIAIDAGGLALAPEVTAKPAHSTSTAEPAPAAQREAARQMFDAKEVDYNPRRPFYITMGVLVFAGVCYGGYVWWQMQPRYSVNTAAVQTAPKPAAPPPAGVAPGAAPIAAAGSAPPPAGVSPGVPTTADARRAAAREDASSLKSPGASPAPVAPVFIATRDAALQRSRASGPVPRAAGSPAEQAPIAITPAAIQPDPILERGYAAYQQGDWEIAREQYQRALERDPYNRDALLGLAAIDARAHSFETAELRYLKLLEINPRDTHAHAGLVALQGNLDPVQSESRIKTLIAGQPDAIHLYFTLGNLYAAQSRWPEAQDAYFKAYSAEPDNPDYAFNLAVGLDQLHQRKLAAEHYRKALALAIARPYAFDRGQAEVRARELER